MTLTARAQTTFDECRRRAENGLQAMRDLATELFPRDRSFIIGANGSYARREVTTGSDIDLFFLAIDAEAEAIHDPQQCYTRKLKASGYQLPSSDGVFSKPLSFSKLCETIGGMDDRNDYITRRMLLLLEGEWISNEAEFNSVRGRLIDQYLLGDLREHQICLFLLNDIIRYWRTICVDFEYKVRNDNKPRAIRLIKLRFSRMMLYLAGVLAVGETYGQSKGEKRRTLLDLLAMPPLVRFQRIVGAAGEQILELYAEFLIALDNKVVRDALSRPRSEGESAEEFSELRQKAQRFRDAVSILLKHRYSDDNPTLAALML